MSDQRQWVNDNNAHAYRNVMGEHGLQRHHAEAGELNALEAKAAVAGQLMAALESIDETAGGSSIQGGFIGEMRDIARNALEAARAAGL